MLFVITLWSLIWEEGIAVIVKRRRGSRPTYMPHALNLQLKQMEYSISLWSEQNKGHYGIPRETDKDYEILGKLQVVIAFLISEFTRLIKHTYIYLYSTHTTPLITATIYF